ncbi:SLC13 family permease [Erythrobacter dokdonensis]|uniref:Na/dicarboxylate cotransporter-like protein n=1 Tax=Erythrobacter dokdonensis DSW-74 TaxID=1300349 RepID=A0A1A7BIS7_9SPHN|nr:DASS family sodium-coupled anion symporter [Erythrobacter dokdonensis]OBV12374.1 Na/dicarboxylate cotransporter-like protein [Erythrobacter dokdonensis DSW-74]
MTARRIGLLVGPLAFALTALLPPPAGMPPGAWLVAGLVIWMAAWWMTEAVPMAITALLPFLVIPMTGIASAEQTANDYFSPILFLLLGGAFIALAIERTGLHCRLSLAILQIVGSKGGSARLLLAFMIAAALLSMLISNTSTTLIMMPMAIAVLEGGRRSGNGAIGQQAAPSSSEAVGPQEGISGALPMGIAFAASIGGLGTIVGSPTNAIAVGLLDQIAGVRISFAQWSLYGVPVVLAGVPLAAWIIARVQRVAAYPFDLAAARAAIATRAEWSTPERRLVPLVALTFAGWATQPLVAPLLPPGAWTDGTIASIGALALFLVPDGTGRSLLAWDEARTAPWSVIFLFGGGLALAGGMQASGLTDWLGAALLPLEAWPLLLVALTVTALVIVVTEFASNVATATGIIPVVAALVVAIGADPVVLALPAALAASWGFMLPAGTGPNAIAWSTGRIRIGRMVKAGALLDLAGVFLIVGVVWGIGALI